MTQQKIIELLHNNLFLTTEELYKHCRNYPLVRLCRKGIISCIKTDKSIYFLPFNYPYILESFDSFKLISYDIKAKNDFQISNYGANFIETLKELDINTTIDNLRVDLELRQETYRLWRCRRLSFKKPRRKPRFSRKRYLRKPYVKARIRRYYEQPEIKAKWKEYYKQPKWQKYQNKYQLDYYHKIKNNPGVKEDKKERNRRSYLNRKAHSNKKDRQ